MDPLNKWSESYHIFVLITSYWCCWWWSRCNNWVYTGKLWVTRKYMKIQVTCNNQSYPLVLSTVLNHVPSLPIWKWPRLEWKLLLVCLLPPICSWRCATLKDRSESYPKLLTTILKALCSSNGRYDGTNVIFI